MVGNSNLPVDVQFSHAALTITIPRAQQTGPVKLTVSAEDQYYQ